MKKVLFSLLVIIMLILAMSALGANQSQEYTVNGQPLQNMTYLQLMDLRESVNENLFKALKREAKARGYGEKFFVINKATKKFHEPACAFVLDIKRGNLDLTDKTRAELIAEFYSPCKSCVPD